MEIQSNPIANYPNWKWEGYPEYIARKHQQDLYQNILHLTQGDQDTWEIQLADGTISPRDYYKNWLLTVYSMDIKGLSYEELLANNAQKDTVEQEMMNWFRKQN